MPKIYVVTGIKYNVAVETFHTRTEIFQQIIGIYTTKQHADEIVSTMKASEKIKYFPNSLTITEYELIDGTYFPKKEEDD